MPTTPPDSADWSPRGSPLWKEEYRAWLAQRVLGPLPAPSNFSELGYRPAVAVLVDLGDVSPQAALRTVRSIVNQSYPNWQLTVTINHYTDESDLALTPLHAIARTDARITFTSVPPRHNDHSTHRASVLASIEGEYVIRLQPGDELRSYALAALIAALNHDPTADVLYSDHDYRLPDGATGAPFFKPDWSPTLLTCFDYLSGLVMYRRTLLLKALMLAPLESEAEDYDLALRLTERSTAIQHIPFPLCTLAERSGRRREGSAGAMRRAVSNALARRGEPAQVEDGRLHGTWRSRRMLKDGPHVSIIIPTRDKLDLLSACIESVTTRSKQVAPVRVLVCWRPTIAPRSRLRAC